eukprot:scaffold18078_cov147-Amphora_coffeaeformis.AAC.2
MAMRNPAASGEGGVWALPRADADLKVWVTGITPIGLLLISGFKPVDLTFKPSMANVVGLLRENVSRMLDAIQQYNPYVTLSQLVKKDVDPGDYLSLLVYLGMVLRVSVERLMQLTAKDDIYSQGVSLLYQFASALSENRMDRFIAWAEAENDNNIMELQLQGFLVQELHATLKEHASTTQEKRPQGQSMRKDITIAGDQPAIILELKKLNGPDPPTHEELDEAHNQLKGYVLAHRTSEKQKKTPRIVAGFVLVMYANGFKYQVQPLQGD